MNIMKKLLPILLGALAISTANAYDNNNTCEPTPAPQCCDPCECKPCEPCAPCCEVPGEPTTPAYNQSAAIDVCNCWDFYVTGTFLWVQPIQEQMEFAATTNADGATSYHKMDFEWKPAFKVGLGYNFQYDKWDGFVEYTRINSEMHHNAKLGDNVSPVAGFWLLTQTNPNPVDEIKNKWNLDFNTFDFNLGRAFWNGTKLSFRCNYGFKAGWIDQKINQEEIATAAATTISGDFKSDSWLIGPRVGICSSWNLGEGFRLFGNGAASVFYQKFHKISWNEPLISDTSASFGSGSESYGVINSALEAMVGLGYGTYFDRNNWHFDLMLGYEAQLFFDQNAARHIEQLKNLNVTKPGNLMFHGLNITARLDF
ncbi:MAG: Lpg1974 family pore-forming outer membrane protein [Parachlamydiales bacterium]